MSKAGLHILRSGETASDGDGGIDPTGMKPVLLVEDDPTIARPLAEALRDEGLEVARAGNGREALQLLRGGMRAAAIILDLMMPVMDGWDFRHEQIADPALRDIPVVIMTATGFSTETIRAQFGNVQLVPKPVRFSTLLEILGGVRVPTSSAA